jgi:hypothetical protein
MLASQFALLPLMHGWLETVIALMLVFAAALVHAGLAEASSAQIYRRIVFNTLPLAIALCVRLFVPRLEFAPLLIISTTYALVISLQSFSLYRSCLFRMQ